MLCAHRHLGIMATIPPGVKRLLTPGGILAPAARIELGPCMPARIEDYALIGDCHTAALVSREGSIDWLCFPRFDSGACFAALLGTPENGRWKIAPVGEIKSVRRRYRGDTLVLETEYETADGAATVVDCMPPDGASHDLV